MFGKDADLVKHFHNFAGIIKDEKLKTAMRKSVINTVQNKQELGLLDFTLNEDKLSETIEVLFLLTSYDKSKNQLDNAIKWIKKKYTVAPMTTKVLMMDKCEKTIDYKKAYDLYTY